MMGWVGEEDPMKGPEPEQPLRWEENQESGLFWKLREGSVAHQVLLMGSWGLPVEQ